MTLGTGPLWQLPDEISFDISSWIHPVIWMGLIAGQSGAGTEGEFFSDYQWDIKWFLPPYHYPEYFAPTYPWRIAFTDKDGAVRIDEYSSAAEFERYNQLVVDKVLAKSLLMTKTLEKMLSFDWPWERPAHDADDGDHIIRGDN